MKNIKMTAQYLLICAGAIGVIYLAFVLIASFAMMDWKYISVFEWVFPVRLIFALISGYVIGCSIVFIFQEWEPKSE